MLHRIRFAAIHDQSRGADYGIAGKQQTVFRIQQADSILSMSEGLDHLQLTSPQIKYLSLSIRKVSM